jgi:hypothetical protein
MSPKLQRQQEWYTRIIGWFSLDNDGPGLSCIRTWTDLYLCKDYVKFNDEVTQTSSKFGTSNFGGLCQRNNI